MCCGVVAHDGLAAHIVDVGGHGVAHRKGTVHHGAEVDIHSVGFFSIVDVQQLALGVDGTVVAHLSAAFTVEGSAVQNHGAVALGDALHRLVVHQNGDDLGVAAPVGVAGELGLRQISQQSPRGFAPAADVGAGFPGTDFLILHQSLEGLLVDLQMIFLGDFPGQIDGEAEGIVQLEYVLAGDSVGVLVHGTADQIAQNGQTGVNGGVKALLFHGENPADVVGTGVQLGITVAALGDGHVHHVDEERAVDAQELTVTACAADDAAKHVAAALV